MLEHYDAGPALNYHWRLQRLMLAWDPYIFFDLSEAGCEIWPNPLSAKHDYCTFNSILTSNAGFTSDGSVTK